MTSPETGSPISSVCFSLALTCSAFGYYFKDYMFKKKKEWWIGQVECEVATWGSLQKKCSVSKNTPWYWTISPIVFHHCFGGSRRLQLSSLTGPTRANPWELVCPKHNQFTKVFGRIRWPTYHWALVLFFWDFSFFLAPECSTTFRIFICPTFTNYTIGSIKSVPLFAPESYLN